MARISTHVLDTSRGAPAAGVVVDLHFLGDNGRHHVGNAVTKADGRTAEALLSGETLPKGVYELTFHAGDYFRSINVALSMPSFLDVIVIRFGVSEENGNYHVPLVLSPYGYSTYRGS